MKENPKITPERGVKNIMKYHFLEPIVSYYMYQIVTPSRKEYELLRDKIQSLQDGDGFGYPMLLPVTTESQPISFDSRRFTGYYIPDYGRTLDSLVKDGNYTIDITTMTITLISLLFTVPAIHRDVHPRNLCIYHPEISFNFIWTFTLKDNLIELSWIDNGFITL